MSVLLPSGKSMPLLAFGTFEIKPEDLAETIKYAVLDVGYRHIDAATYYANETQVGDGLQQVFATGRVSREEIFLVTKCWMSWYRNVREACVRSLQRLQVSYLDLYLLHWPFALRPDPTDPDKFVAGPQQFDDFPLHEVWKQMEALVDEGLVRHIGLSNWTVALTRDLLCYARIKPVCNQFEAHPYNNREKLVRYCQENGIATVAYRVFAASQVSPPKPGVLEDPLVVSLARKYQKSPAQILINWCLRRNCGAVVKTKTPSRLVENWEAQSFELSAEDTAALLGLSRGVYYIAPEELFDFQLFS